MTAILLILAIFACTASYAFGAIIAAGARSDIERENAILRDTIRRTFDDISNNIKIHTSSYYISPEIYKNLQKIYRAFIIQK